MQPARTKLELTTCLPDGGKLHWSSGLTKWGYTPPKEVTESLKDWGTEEFIPRAIKKLYHRQLAEPKKEGEEQPENIKKESGKESLKKEITKRGKTQGEKGKYSKKKTSKKRKFEQASDQDSNSSSSSSSDEETKKKKRKGKKKKIKNDNIPSTSRENPSSDEDNEKRLNISEEQSEELEEEWPAETTESIDTDRLESDLLAIQNRMKEIKDKVPESELKNHAEYAILWMNSASLENALKIKQ